MNDRRDPERTLFLVDGTSNLYRAFHAVRDLSNKQGLPTNALYGFTSMLKKLVKDLGPRYLAVALDLPGPTFRHEAYPEYKATRRETPEALVVQIPYVKRICRAFNVHVLELPGFEADDILGTLADKASKAGYEVVVVASDKDLLQLVGEKVTVYNPINGQFLDSDGVVRVFGVRPEQVPDVLALWGDSSDNIPGVAGIGEKGAKELIRRYGNLEEVLRQSDSVERKSYREGLREHAPEARMSLDLATLRRDAPVEFDPDRFRLRSPDLEAARVLFEELDFTAFLRDLEAPIAPPRGDYQALLDDAALERAVARLLSEQSVAVGLERDHAEPMRARLVGIALGAPSGIAYYVPLAHRGLGVPGQIAPANALRLLSPLLDGPGPPLTGHDIKGDLILLHRLGIEPPRFEMDTMIASYLLNPSRAGHALESVAQEVAGLEVPSLAAVLGAGARASPLDEVPIERATPLVCARIAAVAALRDRLRAGLEKERLLGLLVDLELPLAAVLAQMEWTGVRIDSKFLEGLSKEWEGRIAGLTGTIYALAGKEFNLNSPRQLGEILFETLKLPPGRKTRKTRSLSTNVEVLEELAEEHELPRRVLEYRSLQKLKSTYVDTLPLLVNRETGRVHTSFNQAVAATGRLSSSDPNLQNIPIRTDDGRLIRRAFIPADGALVLSADYSQIELRVLAHLCGDPQLVRAFKSGEDIHRRTAAEVFGVLPELVSEPMRRRAKAVNFGILYGMGPQRLARDQGVSLKEAADFIERYFGRFPRVKAYIDATIASVESDGQVRTLFGRLRHFPELRGSDRNARQQAIRAAVNTTIQGTAADLIKKAMIVLDRRLREGGSAARVTLQVHDELVLEVPEPEVKPVAALVRQVMEGVHALAVPLVVDIRVGPNWLETRDLPQSKD
jgi:DNA polymerase-1